MKLKKKKSKKGKRKELIEKKRERKKISKIYLEDKLIVIEYESIRISSQKHNEML